MKPLINLKNAVIEIATVLGQDALLKKLLVVDTPDAMEAATPEYSVNDLIANNYICVYPPVENRIEDYGRNTFITILFEEAILHASDDNTRATISLYVSTNETHLLLRNNKNRLLEMLDRIIELLDNYKITASGKLRPTSFMHVMLSEFHAAYRLNIQVTDQQARKAEI